MRKMRLSLFVASSLAVISAAQPTPAIGSVHEGIQYRGGSFEMSVPGGATFSAGPKLSNPVSNPMANAVIYPIFYGTWTESQKGLITTFLGGLGASEWFKTESRLYGGLSISAKKPFDSNYAAGESIFNIDSVMSAGISSNRGYTPSLSGNGFVFLLDKWLRTDKVPIDLDGIYLFFLSPDVNIVDYSPEQVQAYNATQENYCGYHDFFQFYSEVDPTAVPKPPSFGPGLSIKYAVIPTNEPGHCRAQSNGPNGDSLVDGALNIAANEIIETMSNPTRRGYSLSSKTKKWADISGSENGDLCAWYFKNVCSTSGTTRVTNMLPMKCAGAYGVMPGVEASWDQGDNYFRSFDFHTGFMQCYSSQTPLYNAEVAGLKVLIQGNYDNSNGKCSNWGGPTCEGEFTIVSKLPPAWYYPR